VRGKRVLIIDDDPEMVELVRLVFAREGAEVYAAADGREGICRYGECRPDLILLDVMMPRLDGWKTCRLLREFTDVPIIFLTALSREQEVVRGLDCGAVDYVTKPFSPQVLLARARVALRAPAYTAQSRQQATFDDGYLSIDLLGRRVRVNGEPVRLTATEYNLLAYLIENAGQVLTHEQILERVWGAECQGSAGYVHVYIWHLRQKLEKDPRRPRYLLTEHGVGYRFEKRDLWPRGQVA
jgi:two-component system KDP operon response regulator KdpE